MSERPTTEDILEFLKEIPAGEYSVGKLKEMIGRHFGLTATIRWPNETEMNAAMWSAVEQQSMSFFDGRNYMRINS